MGYSSVLKENLHFICEWENCNSGEWEVQRTPTLGEKTFSNADHRHNHSAAKEQQIQHTLYCTIKFPLCTSGQTGSDAWFAWARQSASYTMAVAACDADDAGGSRSTGTPRHAGGISCTGSNGGVCSAHPLVPRPPLILSDPWGWSSRQPACRTPEHQACSAGPAEGFNSIGRQWCGLWQHRDLEIFVSLGVAVCNDVHLGCCPIDLLPNQWAPGQSRVLLAVKQVTAEGVDGCRHWNQAPIWYSSLESGAFNGAVKDVLDYASGFVEIFCTVVCSIRHVVPKLLDGRMDQAVWHSTSRHAPSTSFKVRGEHYAVGRIMNRGGQEEAHVMSRVHSGCIQH